MLLDKGGARHAMPPWKFRCVDSASSSGHVIRAVGRTGDGCDTYVFICKVKVVFGRVRTEPHEGYFPEYYGRISRTGTCLSSSPVRPPMPGPGICESSVLSYERH